MSGSTLSEVWYQVADARVSLLPTVTAQVQRFRGRPWVLLEDTYTGRFFRVTPQAFGFISQLDGERSVDEVWRQVASEHPQTLPGQDDVIRLLSQLHLSNLLFFRDPALVDAIFRRAEAQRSRENIGRWLTFLYLRIPLFSPDRMLDAIRPLIRASTGWLGAIVWGLVVAAGAATAVEHREAIGHGSDALLSLGNMPWLYLALALVKVGHETAHAFVCKRYDGHVPGVGLMMLIVTPMPYVDASASWGLRSKWQRAYVGAAGMLAELFAAAVAAQVWVRTGDGLVHSLAYNVMIVGSVSSLLFNGNPLLRFDAYYILSDLVELPNLYQRAQAQWLYYGSRFVLGQRDAVEPAGDRYERVWYTVYGAAAFFYRLSVTFGVLLFVTGKWYAVGLTMLATTAVMLVAMPGSRLIRHLRGPALRQHRGRAAAGAALFVGVLYLALFAIPLPRSLHLHGVLEARQSARVYVRTPGRLVELDPRHGQKLRRGELISRFENRDLDAQLETTRLQLRENQALLGQALTTNRAEIEPLQARIAALGERLTELEGEHRALELRAARDGEWVSPLLHERLGTWLERGQALGEIADGSEFRFDAVVSQADAALLLDRADEPASLRLAARRGDAIESARIELVPFERQRLKSAALGFGGGGEVAVRPDDSSGTLASEAFFELICEFDQSRLPDAVALSGMTGLLRVPVAPATIAVRVAEALRQLLQRRVG